MERRHLVLWPLLIALAVMGYKWLTAPKAVNPLTGKSVRVGMSPDQEETLGLQSYREVLSQSRVLDRGPDHDLVLRVAQRLSRATGEAGQHFQWQVSVVESPEVNAFCLPGGKIVVYTGLLPITQNEPALAAVMGHEMAHALAHHGAQRVLQTSLAQTFMAGARVSVSDMDPQQRQAVLGALGAGAQYGLLLPFGRKHETEADELGLLTMARAGYDPREAIPFWQRMSARGGSQPPVYLSTHPSHGQRIRDLQAFMPKALEAYHPDAGR